MKGSFSISHQAAYGSTATVQQLQPWRTVDEMSQRDTRFWPSEPRAKEEANPVSNERYLTSQCWQSVPVEPRFLRACSWLGAALLIALRPSDSQCK